jgi:hypothetical protein
VPERADGVVGRPVPLLGECFADPAGLVPEGRLGVVAQCGGGLHIQRTQEDLSRLAVGAMFLGRVLRRLGGLVDLSSPLDHEGAHRARKAGYDCNRIDLHRDIEHSSGG